MKPNFDRAENAARQLRINQPNSNFALDVLKLHVDSNIIFETFQNYSHITGLGIDELTLNKTKELSDGYTVKIENFNMILYDESALGTRHLNWTLAHELGHIYLNHSCDDKKSEIEAHWFAAELLMPEILIYMLRNNFVINNSDIESIFNVSPQSALKRVNSLNRMPTHNHFLKEATVQKYQLAVDTFCDFKKAALIV